ncbi:MAG: MBL fold metallo-hydrolase [Gammaproteobacteria bacterium]
MTTPHVETFYHEPTHTFSYVAWDPATREAAVIDPVLDFSDVSGQTGTDSADEILAFVAREELRVAWILETHAHADHLTAAQYLQARTGAPIGIGAGIREVQTTFRELFNLGAELPADGSQFDHLFADGDTFSVGGLTGRVMATPGHTNDSIAYRIGDDAVFVGDTLFRPDYGSARCDFPGGDAGRLYDSVRRLFELPPETRLFLCHDYPEEGTEPRSVTTVAEQRAENRHLNESVSRRDFVRMREQRDAGLGLPRLIIPAIQVNIRAGRMPRAEDNGVAYLKTPINAFPGSDQ